MKTKQTDLLRINLQFFSEEPPTPPADPTPPPTYTQADIDRIVGERLAREKAKTDKAVEEAKAEAERKRLEEESEFKTLYEAERASREQIELQMRNNALQTKKQSLLLEAGYPADKLADVLAFITGDDEDAIVASVERFKVVAPPKPAYADPATGGGARKQPEQKDGTELGRELYERVFKTKK